MTLVEFLVLAFATERITNLIIYDDGPGLLFHKLRRSLRAGEFKTESPDFDRFTDADDEWWLSTDKPTSGFVADLFSCPFCLSVWVGALLGWGWVLWHPFAFVVLPLALSSVAVLINPPQKQEEEDEDGTR